MLAVESKHKRRDASILSSGRAESCSGTAARVAHAVRLSWRRHASRSTRRPPAIQPHQPNTSPLLPLFGTHTRYCAAHSHIAPLGSTASRCRIAGQYSYIVCFHAFVCHLCSLYLSFYPLHCISTLVPPRAPSQTPALQPALPGHDEVASRHFPLGCLCCRAAGALHLQARQAQQWRHGQSRAERGHRSTRGGHSQHQHV